MIDAATHADAHALTTLRAALMRLEDVAPADALIRLVASGALEAPFPGEGETHRRFAILDLLGSFDLSLARLAEGHLDTLAIAHEARLELPPGLFGVWAAGPVDGLRAARSASGWRLEGLRRWCSGATSLTHALVRAEAGDGERLFLVPLDKPGVHPLEGTWPAIGMAASATLDVRFDAVALGPDTEVGAPGFYLDRPGFWAGGAGVAAVWLGGTRPLARALARRAADDPHRLAHLGWMTARLAALDALLRAVADTIDDPSGSTDGLERPARMLRAEVAESASLVLERAARATGADPLSHDRRYAQHAVDLSVYIRQTHGEADLEAIGRLAARDEQVPR